jgi:hypothetical protein
LVPPERKEVAHDPIEPRPKGPLISGPFCWSSEQKKSHAAVKQHGLLHCAVGQIVKPTFRTQGLVIGTTDRQFGKMQMHKLFLLRKQAPTKLPPCLLKERSIWPVLLNLLRSLVSPWYIHLFAASLTRFFVCTTVQ